MAAFEVIASNGKKTEADEVFSEYLSAYQIALLLSRKYLYVALYRDGRILEEYGTNKNAYA